MQQDGGIVGGSAYDRILSSLHWLVEQKVDIPVPLGRGGRGGVGVLEGLRRGQNSTAFGGAEHVENLVPRGGGLHGFRPGQVSSASSSHSPGAADEVFYMLVFALFRT